MTDTPVLNMTRRKLRTPRAAAIAGILFALLYGTTLVLIRLSIPVEQTVSGAVWLEGNPKTVSLALNLIPYSGIAFLWFIGVIRDRLGNLEDRFFGTVFLGSGLLFLALTFVSAAVAGGLLSSYAVDATNILDYGTYTFSRAVIYQIINIYALRMEGVFMISLSTIWLRTGLMERGWSYLTYTLALILLLSVSLSGWLAVIFPVWVFVISVYFLIQNLHNGPKELVDEP
jgi:hypothetical protein